MEEVKNGGSREVEVWDGPSWLPETATHPRRQRSNHYRCAVIAEL